MKIHEANFRLDNVPVCSSTLILTCCAFAWADSCGSKPMTDSFFWGQPHYDPHNHGRVVPPYHLIYVYNKIIILIYIYIISILRHIYIFRLTKIKPHYVQLDSSQTLLCFFGAILRPSGCDANAARCSPRKGRAATALAAPGELHRCR